MAFYIALVDPKKGKARECLWMLLASY